MNTLKNKSKKKNKTKKRYVQRGSAKKPNELIKEINDLIELSKLFNSKNVFEQIFEKKNKNLDNLNKIAKKLNEYKNTHSEFKKQLKKLNVDKKLGKLDVETKVTKPINDIFEEIKKSFNEFYES